MGRSDLELFLEEDAQEKQLEFLSKEKSVSEIMRDTISINILNYNIRGLREVKKNVVDAIAKAAFLSRQGYIPMILLIGPSGSGKTAIVEGIRRKYYDRIRSKENIYTLEINEKECPYKENAYNLLRSAFPFKVKAKLWSNRPGPEVCATCMVNLEKLVNGAGENEGLPIEKVKLKPTFPQTATMQLNDESMPDKFYEVAKNANRGILLISADKSTLGSVSARTYQFLVNLYDNTLSDLRGNRVPLDMLVVMNSNEEFFDGLKKEKAPLAGSTPLRERLLVVKVRRNLSYTEEEKIYSNLNFPIEKTFPGAFRYLAIANVLSRLDLSRFSRNREAQSSAQQDPSKPSLLEKFGRVDIKERRQESGEEAKVDSGLVLSLLYLYETGQINNKKITYSLMSLLTAGDPYENVKNMISENGEYTSGWNVGISSRIVTNHLIMKDSRLFNFSDFGEYLIENEANGLTPFKRKYISDTVTADVMTKLDYAILSYTFRSYSADHDKLKKAIAKLEDYLQFTEAQEQNKNEKRVFEDQDGVIPVISTYMDIELLKKNYKAYVERYAPIEAGFRPDMLQFMEFLYHRNNFVSLVKRDEKTGRDMYDKKSDTYKFLKEFMERNFGYLDECFDEALSIYKNNNIFTYDN